MKLDLIARLQNDAAFPHEQALRQILARTDVPQDVVPLTPSKPQPPQRTRGWMERLSSNDTHVDTSDRRSSDPAAADQAPFAIGTNPELVAGTGEDSLADNLRMVPPLSSMRLSSDSFVQRHSSRKTSLRHSKSSSFSLSQRTLEPQSSNTSNRPSGALPPTLEHLSEEAQDAIASYLESVASDEGDGAHFPTHSMELSDPGSLCSSLSLGTLIGEDTCTAPTDISAKFYKLESGPRPQESNRRLATEHLPTTGVADPQLGWPPGAWSAQGPAVDPAPARISSAGACPVAEAARPGATSVRTQADAWRDDCSCNSAGAAVFTAFSSSAGSSSEGGVAQAGPSQSGAASKKWPPASSAGPAAIGKAAGIDRRRASSMQDIRNTSADSVGNDARSPVSIKPAFTSSPQTRFALQPDTARTPALGLPSGGLRHLSLRAVPKFKSKSEAPYSAAGIGQVGNEFKDQPSFAVRRNLTWC